MGQQPHPGSDVPADARKEGGSSPQRIPNCADRAKRAEGGYHKRAAVPQWKDAGMVRMEKSGHRFVDACTNEPRLQAPSAAHSTARVGDVWAQNSVVACTCWLLLTPFPFQHLPPDLTLPPTQRHGSSTLRLPLRVAIEAFLLGCRLVFAYPQPTAQIKFGGGF